MKSKVLYWIIISIIIISLMFTMVSCKSESGTAVNTVAPEASSGTAASTIAPEIKSTPSPTEQKPNTYSDYELVRAVELGIGECADNTVITHKQFFKMLDVVVALTNEELVTKWQDRLPIARGSDAEMTRAEGMIGIYYAAETLGDKYCNYNTDWDLLNNRIGDPWDTFIFDDQLYPTVIEPTVVGPEWDNRVAAAYFYSFGRLSRYSGNIIFDYDENKNTMHPDKPFMYEDALRAALRLYDSSLLNVTMRVPTQEDEAFLAKADARREAILNSPTTVTVEGKSYYVSNSGDDHNDGLSPSTAWATLKKVNKAKLSEGDGVFFERGGLWRGLLLCQDNVTYSAYGEGEKPKIYGSPENGAGPEKWSLLEGTDNIWVFYNDMYDTGGIVFNEGESWALRMVAFWDGEKYVDIVDKSKVIGPELLDNNQMFSAVDYTGYSSQEARYELQKKGKLYLRCDEGNPGKIYKSIEFQCLEDNQGSEYVVTGKNGNIIDNLCVKYTNASGIIISGSDSTVQNCEVGWVGGAVMLFYEYNTACLFRVGDGICLARGFNAPGVNNSAINNYSHHAYDMAITSEIGDEGDPAFRYVDNVVIRGNLTEKSSGGITLADWSSQNEPEKWHGHKIFRNILIEDNYVMYAGYGWSHQEVDYDWGMAGKPVNNGNASIMFGYAEKPEDAGNGVIVKNNTIYLAKYALIRACINDSAFRYDAIFEGNTYVQNEGGILTEWVKPDDDTYLFCYPYNMYAQETVEDVLGDKSGKTFGLN